MTDTAGIPDEAFASPLLRSLDERARRDVARASRVLELGAGEPAYGVGDRADTLFVVLRGSVRLEAVRRGEDRASTMRVARRGDSFGEEATVPGASRLLSARADEPATIAEVPVTVLQRARVRGGAAADAVERDERAALRAAARDVLGSSALGRELGRDELDMLLDRAEWKHHRRGERVFTQGDDAPVALVIAAGLLQLQSEHDGRVRVCGYLARGDVAGDDDVLAGRKHSLSAVAQGDLFALALPRAALQSAVDRCPALLAGLGRVAVERGEAQERIVGEFERGATQHVFRDLYRLQVARSLLVIEQDSCVRCGHCAWACAETHGESHLVRRGDKIVTQLSSTGAPASLLLPNSCQHCESAACMVDCPTGAIGREPHGEVFIRAELCTGCAACVRACPWDNVQMVPRPGAPPAAARADTAVGTSALVAAKCDLCRDWQAPACVSACPTGSILRVDPSRDFSELAALFRGPGANAGGSPQGRTDARRARALTLASGLGLVSVGLGLGLHQAGVVEASRGVGLLAGVVALPACLVLAGYGFFKRGVRRWLPRRERGLRATFAERAPPPRSRVAPQLDVHVMLGLATLALGALHGGFGGRLSTSGALGLVFWALSLTGLVGIAAYRTLPRWLTRIERRGLLPEDFPRERERAIDRLYRAASGKSELVKVLAERLLLPYARSPLGWLGLVLGRRTLREEEARLHARIDAMLEGRGGDQREGLADLVRIVVELRALPGRRVLTLALRGLVPVHVLLAGMFLLLLLLHVASALGGGR